MQNLTGINYHIRCVDAASRVTVAEEGKGRKKKKMQKKVGGNENAEEENRKGIHSSSYVEKCCLVSLHSCTKTIRFHTFI